VPWTVRSTSDIPTIRVHLESREAAPPASRSRPDLDYKGGGSQSVIDVEIHDEYRDSRVLPSHFNQVPVATLLSGSILDGGHCSVMLLDPPTQHMVVQTRSRATSAADAPGCRTNRTAVAWNASLNV